VEGSCEHGNEPSGSIKCWEILEWLHNWRLLKKRLGPMKLVILLCKVIRCKRKIIPGIN
jgi:hypothetical protein